MIVGRAVAAFIAAAACFACGGSGSTPHTLLRLDDVAAAVTAVEQARGGAQRYTEINVGPGLVNLFVVVDDTTELAYVYRNGKLEAPGAPTPRVEDSTEFDLAHVDVSATVGFDDRLRKDLPDSELTRLGLIDAPPTGLAWRALLTSAKGGTFEVIFGADGSLIGALPNADPSVDSP